MGSELGGSQPCAPAAQDASSISGLHEHHHSSGDRGKGLFPALGVRETVSKCCGRFGDSRYRKQTHEGRRANGVVGAGAAARGGKAAGVGLAQPGAEAVSGAARSTLPEPAGVGIHHRSYGGAWCEVEGQRA